MAVHIDDFGTGRSSLNQLHQLPIDTLKIDSSFVSAMGHEPAAASSCAPSWELGHNLDMRVVAEGVETEERLRDAARHGLRRRPGLPVSPPVPPAAVVPLVDARPSC